MLQPPEELPPPPAPAGTYNFCVLVGNTLHVSGIGPLAPTAESHLGPAADAANGVRAARACALTMLSVLRKELGSLNHVKRLVKANGFVVADPASGGGRHPEMMNGFSETMMEIFGERGKGARSVVGVASLPRGWTMEVDAVFELHENL